MAISISAETSKKLQARAERDRCDPNHLLESILSVYLSGKMVLIEPAKPDRRRSSKLPPPDAQHLRKRVSTRSRKRLGEPSMGDRDARRRCSPLRSLGDWSPANSRMP